MNIWTGEGLSFPRWLLWRGAWLLVRLTLVPLLRVRVKGRENIPEHGGAMLLANHATFWDFLLCFWGIYRPAHGIGSDQVFRLPVAGWLLTQLNGIPYAKGGKDGAAVRSLAEAYAKGQIIGMFPEGERSWTGAPLPIKRGTGRLVKSLGCPVIYCRVYTGFLQFPRWATWPRFVPWLMEYLPMETFPPEATEDDINAAIARGLAIDPDQVPLPPGSWGFRLAVGLPDFLWACPACYTFEALKVQADKNVVACERCGRGWRVDLRSSLKAQTPDTEDLTVAVARQRLGAHFPVNAEIRCDHMDVTVVHRGRLRREPVASGAARLTDDALEIYDGDRVLWSLPYRDMSGVVLQFRNALQVRGLEGSNYQLDPAHHSTLRWHHFLLGRVRAQGLEVMT